MSSSIEALQQRLEQVEAERGALAAHVERITRAPATHEILEEIHRRAGKEWGGDFTVTVTRDDYEAFEAEQEALLIATPTTSLARRDAAIKADALEAISQQLSLDSENARENQYHWSADAMQDASDAALQEAAKCRQQA
ncbi:hypothetical protein TW86_22670, partial [Halomonas sp. S2151]|uniref:hypothetical protein n=1 Tax=Halomonas sp. S2151 TaxID=579478 RepID=UPI0005FA7C3E